MFPCVSTIALRLSFSLLFSTTESLYALFVSCFEYKSCSQVSILFYHNGVKMTCYAYNESHLHQRSSCLSKVRANPCLFNRTLNWRQIIFVLLENGVKASEIRTAIATARGVDAKPRIHAVFVTEFLKSSQVLHPLLCLAVTNRKNSKRSESYPFFSG